MKLREMVRRRVGRCVRCGSRMTPIVYGYPGAKMREDAEAGRVVIGGCVIHQGWSPTKVCLECGSEGWSGVR